MKTRKQSDLIYGKSAPAVRLTPLGAAIFAIAVAVPGGALIAVLARIAGWG